MNGKMKSLCCPWTLFFLLVTVEASWFGHRAALRPPLGAWRGGGDAAITAPSTSSALEQEKRELTLDEKVHAAMRKLGLEPPEPDTSGSEDHASDDNILASTTAAVEAEARESERSCENGVCEIPDKPPVKPEDPNVIVERIVKDMKVDSSLAWAALGATSEAADANRRVYNEQAARDMIQVELDMIANIPDDSAQVDQLVSEGHSDRFLVRRALAFAERNMEDARAILLAEEEEQELEEQQQEDGLALKTINVDAGFDPTRIREEPTFSAKPRQPAARESVIFEATASQVFKYVHESPVPVLLDVYADWCGPCKALSPILEEMAIKSGGAFRLVKVNSDNEKAVASTLEVSALPTIFGIRDGGQIVHMFQGMPKSEEMLKNFLMGLLVPGQSFTPPVTDAEKRKYADLSRKLLKVATTAGFPFSARERLNDLVAMRLEELVSQTGNILDAEHSAKTLRSLVSNVIRDPYDIKFRKINLKNKVISDKVSQFPACVALLKSVGFAPDGADALTLGKDKKIVNIAPLTIIRDSIDKWIDKTRFEVAKEARRRKDEADRELVQAELADAAAAAEEEDEDELKDEIDPEECLLKLRLDGKKKVHDVVIHADEPLRTIMERIPGVSLKDDEVQITCVAKRLVVKSSDTEAMSMSLREHGLLPTAALVIKTLGSTDSEQESTLSARAVSKKKKKKGSHTMQSVGIYSKDDNAKGELIDGGGGTWYEHDVSDDENEAAETPVEADAAAEEDEQSIPQDDIQ